MTKKILVAYASVSGSTGEVAQAIGDVLAEHGAIVEVEHVRHIKTVAGYHGAVVGSSIRAGRWLPEASQFVEVQADTLRQIPVAYFTTCLTMVTDSADNRQTVLAYMEPILQIIPEVKPVGLGLFAGSLDPNRSLMAQLNPNLAPHGDYRDWNAIKQWATEIAASLLGKPAMPDEVVILRDASLSSAELSGLDWQGADLSRADLTEADLSKSDLSDSDLSETDLVRAELAEANLRRARLQKAGMNWADLNLANLVDADLHNANLIGADLNKANLRGANLSGAVLNGANLSEAALVGANLQGADLNWTNLSGADLQDANLNQASLGWANLSRANLAGVILEKAVYNYYTQWPDNFDPEEAGAILMDMTRR